MLVSIFGLHNLYAQNIDKTMNLFESGIKIQNPKLKIEKFDFNQAVYDKKEIKLKQSKVLQLPPADFKIKHHLLDSVVKLNWWIPGTDHWLYYYTGEETMGIGTGETAEFDVAIKYDSLQLVNFKGMTVSQLSFLPVDTNTVYTIKVWKGKDASTLVLEQPVKTFDPGKWNTVVLDVPFKLEDGPYYFGYHCATDGYPAGCDYGPTAAKGKSDLINLGDGFVGLFDLANIETNWKIQVFLEDVDGTMQVPDAFNVYRNNEIVGNSIDNQFLDTLKNGGSHYYSVSALYGEYETEKTDSIVIYYDNARVDRNLVVFEGFVDVNSYNCVGIEQGFNDMVDKGLKVAPILFHWAYMGAEEPYHSEQSQERVVSYLDYNIISGFPVSILNGWGVVQGGAPESLYDTYLEAYDECINMKTPIAQVSKLIGQNSGLFELTVDLKKVGYVADPSNLVLHTVLVQNKIAYEWQGQSELNYVMKEMIPNSSGTKIEFNSDNTAEVVVNIELDAFGDNDNLMVVTFVQDVQTGEIHNGDYLEMPKMNYIRFKAENNGGIVEGAEISVAGKQAFTNDIGMAMIGLSNNLGEVEFAVSKEGYNTVNGMFDVATADTVLVNLIMTGINEVSEANVSIYPNPSKGDIVIESEKIREISIMNISGQVMGRYLFSDDPKVNLNINDLEMGVYFISVKTAKGLCVKRVLKQ